MKVRVTRPRIVVPGFRFAGVHCGLKQRRKRDVALIVSDRPAVAVGAFTTNRVKAAPVVIGQQRLRGGVVQAILVNSGNANAYTGAAGEAVARELTALVARELGIPARWVVPSSTGRIGVPLPRARVRAGVRAACRALRPDGFHRALDGIMTTDAFPKFAAQRVIVGGRAVTVAGMAKGAGMIAPHMATLLAYVLTDAAVERAVLRRALAAALPESFNAIVVDGDTSTNDTLLLLANGTAGNRVVRAGSADAARLTAAIRAVSAALARAVVKDAEGGTKVIDIVVRGARSPRDAARVADAIARSPLCKTAFFGGDPYAGRIVCAAGYSGARFDPGRLDVFLDEVPIVRRGVEIVAAAERRAARIVARPEFTLTLDLHAGRASARRMASDLTVAYVRFNSAYRT
jgi:glutamate N-acetyltransferase/amino-acid N-acetyltransferase